eukprot:12145884-Heterocapsa_arctica.AAC.1
MRGCLCLWRQHSWLLRVRVRHSVCGPLTPPGGRAAQREAAQRDAFTGGVVQSVLLSTFPLLKGGASDGLAREIERIERVVLDGVPAFVRQAVPYEPQAPGDC